MARSTGPFGLKGAWGGALAGPSWTSAPRLGWVLSSLFVLLLGIAFGIAALLFEEVRIAWGITAGVLFVGAGACAVPAILSIRKLRMVEQLRLHGVSAKARVLGFTQTGAELQDQPFVRLELEVRVDGEQPYRVEVGDYVPQTMVGRLTDHLELPVRVDPSDPTKVVVDWSTS